MRAARGGFALVELLVALVLFALAAQSLAGLQRMLVREQSTGMAEFLVQSETARASRILRRTAEAASHVEIPPPGAASNTTLTLWENRDPSSGTPILAGQPSRYAHFCKDRHSRLLLYRGEAPLPDILCGVTESAEVVAGESAGGMALELLFERPPVEDDVLRISCRFRLAGSAARPAAESGESAVIVLRGPRRLP